MERYKGRGKNPKSIEALKAAAASRVAQREKVSVHLLYGVLDVLDTLGDRNRSIAINEAIGMIEELGLIEQLKQRVQAKKKQTA
ncbi:hypothetical protein [Brasilonema sp. UFV-L1]|uniref:hypothetical protein n=1 Tax=Brasilonema sp. UFV-L1 TaxID=2234130 RepID=UPI00145CE4FD|nr:hypothetical protein [Brasilonema sp. UFV-L1]NMG11787.1 hypothetical protein [Brasilonema sp. UFV-L1]